MGPPGLGPKLSGSRRSGASCVSPARQRGSRTARALVADEQTRPVVVEVKAHLAQAFLGHRLAQSRRIIGVEEQEAAAAGANQFAPPGAMGTANLVPAVDGIVLVPPGGLKALPLDLPVLVHQVGEDSRVAFLERLLHKP